MKLKMLAGVAAVAALIATPAMAKSQEKVAGPKQQSADQIGVKKVKKAQKTQARHVQARESRAAVEPRNTGFPPLDFATGVVGGAVNTAGAIAGGAVNTAGAIATAPFTPFRGDSYAYYRDTSTMPNRGFIADDNGPTCLPGQLIIMNGQQMRCQ